MTLLGSSHDRQMFCFLSCNSLEIAGKIHQVLIHLTWLITLLYTLPTLTLNSDFLKLILTADACQLYLFSHLLKPKVGSHLLFKSTPSHT